MKPLTVQGYLKREYILNNVLFLFGLLYTRLALLHLNLDVLDLEEFKVEILTNTYLVDFSHSAISLNIMDVYIVSMRALYLTR